MPTLKAFGLFQKLNKNVDNIPPSIWKTTLKHKFDLLSASELQKLQSVNRPKKALFAYLFFVRETRSTFHEQHKKLNGVQVTQKLAEMWNGMSESEKSRFMKLAEKDKERYANELKECLRSLERQQGM